MLILIIFFITVLLITTRIVHHTTAALFGAVLASIALIVNGVPDQEILAMVRLEPILVITGVTVVAEMMRGAGVFQFLAVYFIRLTRGNPNKLFLIFCLLTAALSTVLLNTVVILIMGYLVILTCYTLEIKPHGFFLGQILAVGAGGAFTLIGTTPNVIIADYAGFGFDYYITRFGILALIVITVSLVAVFLMIRHQLIVEDSKAFERVMDLDPWMMVPNRRLFWAYGGLFVLLIVAFVLFPQPYVVAIGGMMVFMTVSHADPRASLRDIEWDIIFFIGGLFVLAGALELVGILSVISDAILLASGGQLIPTSLMLLWGAWIGAFIIGGPPIATVFAPLVVDMATVMGWSIGIRDPLFWGVGFGAALGGIATPFGAVPLLVLSMVSFNNSKMSWRRFLISAILVNIIQIVLCSIYIVIFALLI
ncbi:MAG: SLC13 family permease [Candidatus Thorarchaeota archaeon]|jgi:Na+/H+ antiporter NhaD/arsenite permease-like protein